MQESQPFEKATSPYIYMVWSTSFSWWRFNWIKNSKLHNYHIPIPIYTNHQWWASVFSTKHLCSTLCFRWTRISFFQLSLHIAGYMYVFCFIIWDSILIMSNSFRVTDPSCPGRYACSPLMDGKLMAFHWSTWKMMAVQVATFLHAGFLL